MRLFLFLAALLTVAVVIEAGKTSADSKKKNTEVDWYDHHMERYRSSASSGPEPGYGGYNSDTGYGDRRRRYYNPLDRGSGRRSRDYDDYDDYDFGRDGRDGNRGSYGGGAFVGRDGPSGTTGGYGYGRRSGTFGAYDHPAYGRSGTRASAYREYDRRPSAFADYGRRAGTFGAYDRPAYGRSGTRASAYREYDRRPSAFAGYGRRGTFGGNDDFANDYSSRY